VSLRVDDLNVCETRAQTERFQIMLDDGEEVVPVPTVAVSVEICGVLRTTLVSEKVLLELLRDAVRAGGELEDFCAARVACEDLRQRGGGGVRVLSLPCGWSWG
jgi:hypothetical protein